MLIDLKEHAAALRREADNYESRIDGYYKENQDETADVLDELTRESRARALVYGDDVIQGDAFKTTQKALAYLVKEAEELRLGINEDAIENGSPFEFQMSRDFEAAQMLREIADALVILLN